MRKALSLIFSEKGKILVVRRTLIKQTHAGLWSLPSTYIGEAETLKSAAERLAKNKLGIDAINIEDVPLGIFEGEHVEGGFDFEMKDYKVMNYDSAIHLNQNEYTDLKWISADRIEDFIKVENNGVVGYCCQALFSNYSK